MFKTFLTVYQTDSPMVPFLYGNLYRLLRDTFLNIIRPAAINNCETILMFGEFNFYKNVNYF